MGLTLFKGMVGAITGYLRHPKVGNSGHVFFCVEVVSIITKGLAGIGIIRSHSRSCGVIQVLWGQYYCEMSLNDPNKL